MTTLAYRTSLAILTTLLTIALALAWFQKKDLDHLISDIDRATLHHVVLRAVDSDTGTGIVATVKGPFVRTLNFPVAVDLKQDRDDPTYLILSWFGHPTEIEVSAPGYTSQRVHVDEEEMRRLVITMKKAQQEAGPYGSPAAGSPSGQP